MTETNLKYESTVNITYGVYIYIIGVHAQSTLGGKTFLHEKSVWNINKMPEIYTILARKINKIPEFHTIFPKNARVFT